MQFKNFIGIDVSKNTFDLALIKNNDSTNILSADFSNTHAGIVDLEKFINQQRLNMTETLICMEHTGVYCRLLSHYLTERKYYVWLEMPVQIIRSTGIQRGKSDKIDAKRIAKYALYKQDKAILWQPPREVLIEINDLLVLRDRLVETRKSLKQPIKELKDAGLKEAAALIENRCKETLNAVEKEIKEIEKELNAKIKKDSNLKKLYNLLISVPGVGKITALTLLYYTNEFKYYTNAKQLACYCGVAPFEHTSGSSIRGRTRVSNFANKRLKKLFHLVAMTTLNRYPEFSNYYKRKLLEGKKKMVVINAIRNKIIHRLCAVINRQTPYQFEYHFA